MANTTISIPWAGWELGKTLGGGSFGKVYEICRTLPGGITERAAMKVISVPADPWEARELLNSGFSAESISQRYRSDLDDIAREYSLMSTLKGNANIVYCDDVQSVPHGDGMGWDLYIKMELLIPLNTVLVKPYSEDQTIRLGLDLCSALNACRKRNIIHRDIKPQNIMVSPDGRFKLGDFGVAKTAERTAGGTKTGTYNYMAPEVFNNKPYGAAADLYSVGMVLYWMMNRQCGPFLPLPPTLPTASQIEDAKVRRFRGDALPAPAYGSPRLKQIVLKACAFDPQQRYASSQELYDALSSLLHGHEDDDPTVLDEQPVSGAYRGAPYRSAPRQEPAKAATSPKAAPPRQEPPKAAAQPRTDLDVHKTVIVSSNEAKFGCTHTVTLDNGQKVSVKIPAGARNLRLPGQGKQDPVTKQTGNLYLTITTNNESKSNTAQTAKPAAKASPAAGKKGYSIGKLLIHLGVIGYLLFLIYSMMLELGPVEGPTVAIVTCVILLLCEIMRMRGHPRIAVGLMLMAGLMLVIGLDISETNPFLIFILILFGLYWFTCPTSVPKLPAKVQKVCMTVVNVICWGFWLYQAYDSTLGLDERAIMLAVGCLILLAVSQYLFYKKQHWGALALLVLACLGLALRIDSFYRQSVELAIILLNPIFFWLSCRKG